LPSNFIVSEIFLPYLVYQNSIFTIVSFQMNCHWFHFKKKKNIRFVSQRSLSLPWHTIPIHSSSSRFSLSKKNIPPIHRPSKNKKKLLHFNTTCQMKYVFLLVWGIFRKFPVQAKLSFSPYACCVHARGGWESFLFF